jgi:hypothetical protein
MLTPTFQSLPYQRIIVEVIIGSDMMPSIFLPAGLKIGHNFMRLSALWVKNYTFVPGQIKQIKADSYFFRRGIRIIHCRSDYPKFIMISSSDPVNFWVAMLNQAGFNLPE